jgi:hypothetical protein
VKWLIFILIGLIIVSLLNFVGRNKKHSGVWASHNGKTNEEFVNRTTEYTGGSDDGGTE